MNEITSAYLDGMWHGGLGVGLIIFGIIGWPQTRFVLRTLFGFKAKRPKPRKMFWEQYK
jgi:hypothetical protein